MSKFKRLILLVGLLGIAFVTNVLWESGEQVPNAHAGSTITVEIPLVTGYNFITIPVNFGAGFTVKDMADQIGVQGGQVVAVFGWDVQSQAFIPWISALPHSNVFTIHRGKGYLVHISTPPSGGSWIVTGEEITENEPTDLSAGRFDMIGLPGLSQSVTDPRELAASVEAAGGELASVVAWDDGLQKYAPWAPVSSSVNLFQITNLIGFWIRAAEDISEYVASRQSSDVTIMQVSDPPSGVHVELNPGGVIVSWVSPVEEDGFIEWALSAGDLAARSGTFATALDSRGQFQDRTNKWTHHVEIRSVAASQTLHFDVFSGGARDPNGPFTITLPMQPLVQPPTLLTGMIVLADQSGAEECLVYARVTHLAGGTFLEHSLWVVGLTKNGRYTLDLTNVRGDPDNVLNTSVDQRFGYDPSGTDSTIEVVSRCSSNVGGSMSVTTAAAQRIAAGYVVDLSVVLPEPNDDSYMTPPGHPLAVSAPGVLANDGFGATSLQAGLVTGPSHGTLVLDPDGGFTYTPDQGYVGDDVFTYKATVEGLESSVASVTIMVQLPKVPSLSGGGLVIAALLLGAAVIVGQRRARSIFRSPS